MQTVVCSRQVCEGECWQQHTLQQLTPTSPPAVEPDTCLVCVLFRLWRLSLEVVNSFMCTHLIDEHAGGHREAGPGGEMTGDHDPHAGLRERQLVGVCGQQLVDHQHRRGAVEVSWKEKKR